MTRQAVGRGFRTRKLSNKQNLAVIREHQIDAVDDDGQRNIPQIETGVERQEEIEHHLQAAIANQAASKKIFIPTPNTSELSVEHYDRLYPKGFAQPASYIRFSSTVEDCSGTGYCMSAVDEAFLAKLNANKPRELPISAITGDDFEHIMDRFESYIQSRHPFLYTNFSEAKIPPFEDLMRFNDPPLTKTQSAVAELVYPHWKEQKIARAGFPIIPLLKFEQGTDKDDGDPYVCFRRREIRQVRKTRRTDAQSTDKLRKLRQELEAARGLVKDVVQRESMRKSAYIIECQVYEGRQTLIQLKRKLGIKGDDEDLINKPKRRATEQLSPALRPPPMRQDVKLPDADLRQLSQIKSEEERKRVEKYTQLRNSRPTPKYGVVDLTGETLFASPTPTQTGSVGDFCGVETFFLPSPPPSGDSSDETPDIGPNPVSIIQASPKKLPTRRVNTFRRRLGRGGRVLIDRRGGVDSSLENLDPDVADRMRYDNEDSDVQQPVFSLDPHSVAQIQFRSRMLSPPAEASAHVQQGARRPVPITTMPNQQPVASQAYRAQAYFQQQYVTNGHHPPAGNNGYRVPRTQNMMPNHTIPQLMVNGHVSPPASANPAWSA